MKVSVVTVSFNQARFLERAIRSVLGQDYDDIEYIVVDPGSTDGSRAIVERWRDRIDRIILEPDRGPPDGLNKGFAAATGEIFAYLNADDALLPGAVRAAVGDALVIQVTSEAVGRYAPAEQMAMVRALAPEAVSLAACQLADQVGAVAMICLTNSGATARSIARHRPRMPLYAFTDEPRIVGQMGVLWGTKAFSIPFQDDTDAGVGLVHQTLLKHGLARRGDPVVITAGMPLPKKGRTNMVHVSHIV